MFLPFRLQDKAEKEVNSDIHKEFNSRLSHVDYEPKSVEII